MHQIDAVYQNGVLKPLSAVPFHENQRVRLRVEPAEPAGAAAWLDALRRIQQPILDRHGGPLPDSTADIAADRLRDA